jgi:hypothetical protein
MKYISVQKGMFPLPDDLVNSDTSLNVHHSGDHKAALP